MRIRWKDSSAKMPKNPIKYRGCILSPYNKDGITGWILDFEDDHNIYASHYCAMNAVNVRLGGYGSRGKPSKKREKCGIQIVGTYQNK